MLPGCSLCPRLVEFRLGNKAKFPDWHNEPVPAFGELEAELLVVGMAPGLRGANRTGRPFTGDYAGELLYSTLLKYGWAEGEYQARIDDNYRLLNCRVSNAARCVPPENKLEGTEIRNCNQFLRKEIGSMPRLRTIVSIGRDSHEAVLTALGLKKSVYKFAHGAVHKVGGGRTLFDSYHCSRYNTNTGRLTEAMFHQVFTLVAESFGHA